MAFHQQAALQNVLFIANEFDVAHQAHRCPRPKIIIKP